MNAYLWRCAGEVPDGPDEEDLRLEYRECLRRQIRDVLPLRDITDPLVIPDLGLESGPVHPSFVRDTLGVYAAEEPGRLP